MWTQIIYVVSLTDYDSFRSFSYRDRVSSIWHLIFQMGHDTIFVQIIWYSEHLHAYLLNKIEYWIFIKFNKAKKRIKISQTNPQCHCERGKLSWILWRPDPVFEWHWVAVEGKCLVHLVKVRSQKPQCWKINTVFNFFYFSGCKITLSLHTM